MKAPLHRIAARLYSEPWLIRPDKHAALCQQFRAAALDRAPGAIELRLPHVNAANYPNPLHGDDSAVQVRESDRDCLSSLEIAHGIAIVPVFGIIGKHLDMIDMMCGGYDLNVLTAQAIALQSRADVHTVVLHLNTPGGAAAGVADAAQVLLELGQSKRLIAFVDEACSGGQWLACACEEIYIGVSSMAGCIGCMCAVLDESKAYAEEGLEVNKFVSAPLKGAGVEGTSLTAEQSAEIQARVNRAGDQFKEFIRARRPDVPDEALLGQWFYGDRALEFGLADHIAPSLEHCLAAVLTPLN